MWNQRNQVCWRFEIPLLMLLSLLVLRDEHDQLASRPMHWTWRSEVDLTRLQILNGQRWTGLSSYCTEQQCVRKWLHAGVRRMLESIGAIIQMPDFKRYVLDHM